MRATLFSLAAVSLLQLSSAQPHRRHQAHHAAHVKKDVVTVISTAYGEATAASEVVVFVNPQGKPVSTLTQYVENEPLPTAAPVPTTVSQVAAPIVTTSSSIIASSSVAPMASSSSASAAPSSAVGSPNGAGMTYNPYNPDGTCKTSSQVMADIAAIPGGYSRIRVYGVDCGTVPNVLAACRAHGLKLWVGLFSLVDIESDIATVVAGVAGGWDDIVYVNIGNELVNSGQADAGSVMGAVSQARSLLRGAGYNGPVGAVDTCVATLSNPELCNESDWCTCNSHPFFDDNTAPAESGPFLLNMIGSLKGILSDASKPIVIAETGYPHQGQKHGLADPSPQGQAAALSSMKSVFTGDLAGAVNFFSAYDTPWKQDNPSTYGAEKYWGEFGNCPSDP